VIVKSEVPVKDIKVDIPGRVQEAYARRPEVKSTETVIELSKKNIRLQRTGAMPSLDLTANYNYNFRISGFTTANESWIALAALKVPVWDGGVTKAKVDEAYADKYKAEHSLEQTKNAVALEVRVAALNLQDATERVASTAENVTLAEETLRLANIRYNAGAAILVEVTDAESALTQARYNLVVAQYDYATALAELERATSTQPEVAKLQSLAAPA
jgi:outer membrane protein TolC